MSAEAAVEDEILFSHAEGINESGQVVGAIRGITPDGSDWYSGFVWQNGVLSLLPTPEGSNTTAFAINELGVVAGRKDLLSGESVGVFWENGVIHELQSGSGDTLTPVDINDSGQIVGFSSAQEAFLYDSGSVTNLGSLGGSVSQATAINNSGQIVGISQAQVGEEFEVRAFLYENGSMQDLFGRLSRAFDINDRAQIIGDLSIPNESGELLLSGILYDGGAIVEISSHVSPRAINNAGVIVGTELIAPGDPDGFVYRKGTIESLVELADSCWSAIFPNDINDRGQIVGSGFTCDALPRERAVLLDPIRVCGRGRMKREPMAVP